MSYKNIRRKKGAVAPLQEGKEEVRKVDQGRPRRDNMERCCIKMDRLMRVRVRDKAEEMNVSISFIIGEALRQYLSDEKKEKM